MKLTAIILAAGRGERMGAACNKTLLPLAGRPVLCHVLDIWYGLAAHVVVAANRADWREIAAICAPYGEAVQMTQGGLNRAASLARALAVLPPAEQEAGELVAVHDAARPLTSQADIQRTITAAEQYGAAILAAPVTDTVRYISETTEELAAADGLCGAVLPREQLLAAQTPQIFRRDWLVQAYAAADEQTLCGITDDAMLLQAQGHQCAYVLAQGPNLKLTKPEDMAIAEEIMNLR